LGVKGKVKSLTPHLLSINQLLGKNSKSSLFKNLLILGGKIVSWFYYFNYISVDNVGIIYGRRIIFRIVRHSNSYWGICNYYYLENEKRQMANRRYARYLKNSAMGNVDEK
jgi:hypothetical protein